MPWVSAAVLLALALVIGIPLVRVAARVGDAVSRARCSPEHPPESQARGLPVPGFGLAPRRVGDSLRQRLGGRMTGSLVIRIIENGPIVVDTDRETEIAMGEAAERRKGPIFLCRCGQSANKPFCDGTHRKVGFEAAGAEVAIR